MLSFFSLPFLKNKASPWLHISTGFINLLVLGVLGLSLSVLYAQVRHFFKIDQRIYQTSLDIANFQQQRGCLIQFEKEKQNFPKLFGSFNQAIFTKEISSDDIHHYFQKWQNFYRIETLNLKFDNRAPYKQNLDLWKTPIVVSVKVLKDYQFYGLLNKIQNELPGKVSIKYFSLKRVSPLTRDMVKQITQGKKNINLFEGKIEFDWFHREVKDLSILKVKRS